MSQPFSRVPEPAPRPIDSGPSRPFKRRMQPRLVQEAWQSMLRGTRHYARRGRQYGGDLWRRSRRYPRAMAATAGAIGVTLIGVYALNASAGPAHSLCPASYAKSGGKRPPFLLLMDSQPRATSGSELEIHYDVCGLPSGTPYRGRIQLSPSQRSTSKKKPSAQLKPLVVTFRDKASGVASRHGEPLKLGTARPGTYSLELSITDNQGRARKRVQKILVQ
jgi:hypothetical protein